MFTDPSFKDFQDCLDAEMKHLTGLGVGSKVKEAHAFSEDEENKLRYICKVGELEYSIGRLVTLVLYLWVILPLAVGHP